ncbi:hypothetical protein [Ruegeria sp. HKCCD7318]|uniref:hypothetical protein n=1 Tax=Ruegeria sp. HKCCD7318 TaxID=2683014 RepID=UPI0014916F72|nr:hypothetical protein [Ruegeria sp. HKCCD7318]NOE32296.1 hypothetical protein [Ruegeria sp. HKCCD7318]
MSNDGTTYQPLRMVVEIRGSPEQLSLIPDLLKEVERTIGVDATFIENPISIPLEDDPEPVELNIPDPDITPDQGGLIGDPVGEEYELRKKDRDRKIELSKVKITELKIRNHELRVDQLLDDLALDRYREDGIIPERLVPVTKHFRVMKKKVRDWYKKKVQDNDPLRRRFNRRLQIRLTGKGYLLRKTTLQNDGSMVAEVEFPSLKIPPMEHFLERVMLRHPRPNLPLIPLGP